MLCFTAGAGEPASWWCVSVNSLVRHQTLPNKVFEERWCQPPSSQTVDRNRNEGGTERQPFSPGSWLKLDTTRAAWQRNLNDRVGWLVGQLVDRLVGGCAVCCVLMLMTSPGFWSAVVLCLYCWAARACHWGWGLSAWATGKTRTAPKRQFKGN